MNNAIVLCAGKSSRFGVNKLSVKINGKTLPQYIMDFCIDNEITNVFITISKSNFYFENNVICHEIMESLKGYYSNLLNIKYEFQNEEEYGPAAAIKCWKGKVNGPFIVLFGDNYYKGQLKEFQPSPDVTVSYLTKGSNRRNLQLAAIVDNIIIEKPHQIVKGNYFCGYAAFNEKVWANIDNIAKSGRNEYEITDLINFCDLRVFRKNELEWSDVTYQGDIAKIKEIVDAGLRKKA